MGGKPDGKTEEYLLNKIKKKEKMIFAVIDPIDYDSPEHAIKTAVASAEGGATAIIVGGSIGVQGEILEHVVKNIKEKVKSTPVILFPGNIATVSKNADAIYYMSLLNSRNPYWISQAQVLAAPVVRRAGIEPLSVAYLVVEPGGTVGWVGDANLIPRDKPKFAVALAMAAEYMGFHFILMDAGSASEDGPIRPEMIAAVRKSIALPLIVAGGIRSVQEAVACCKAGADIIHVGTILEKSSDPKATVKEIIIAINKK